MAFHLDLEVFLGWDGNWLWLLLMAVFAQIL